MILSCWFNPDQVDENGSKSILLKLVRVALKLLAHKKCVFERG